MKIFGYKMNIVTLIFVSIVIILVSHTYCGCNDPYALIEGMESDEKKIKKETVGSNPPTNPPTNIGDTETPKEGFTGGNTNYGQSSPYDLSINNPVDTSSWMAPNMTVTPGQPLNPAVKAFLARPKQQLPLPEGEMNFFANTRFAPEFCPNTYSTSQGCAEMSVGQYNYLITRGGNNVPYSEY